MITLKTHLWLEKTPWNRTVSLPMRAWCSLFIFAMYEGGPEYIRDFLPLAAIVATLFWVPENRLLVLIRCIAFWGLSLALIHRFSPDSSIYLKDNLFIQPILFTIGCVIGYLRFTEMMKVKPVEDCRTIKGAAKA